MIVLASASSSQPIRVCRFHQAAAVAAGMNFTTRYPVPRRARQADRSDCAGCVWRRPVHPFRRPDSTAGHQPDLRILVSPADAGDPGMLSSLPFARKIRNDHRTHDPRIMAGFHLFRSLSLRLAGSPVFVCPPNGSSPSRLGRLNLLQAAFNGFCPPEKLLAAQLTRVPGFIFAGRRRFNLRLSAHIKASHRHRNCHLRHFRATGELAR